MVVKRSRWARQLLPMEPGRWEVPWLSGEQNKTKQTCNNQKPKQLKKKLKKTHTRGGTMSVRKPQIIVQTVFSNMHKAFTMIVHRLWLSACLIYLQTHRTYSFCGTIEYMAPEIIKSNVGHDFVSNTFPLICGTT